MARIKRSRRCTRPATASSADDGCVDLLSALPDDLLRLILGRLDTRTALSTAVLARRWARLSRDLPRLDLRVNDKLPQRYHRAVALRRSRTPGYRPALAPAAAVLELDALTGPYRWIVPRPLETKLTGLRQLLVAEMPSSWDVTWPRLLPQAAPALEVLHIHVAHHPGDDERPPGREISWQPSRFQHRHLKELVLAGFRRTWRQIFFVRYLARVCRSLQRVALLRDWCVRQPGLWDWEVVQEQERECPWGHLDKMVIRRKVKYGRTWCRPLLQVIVD